MRFDGVDARLSRYSYLVSLLPRRIIEDLGARVRLARRRYSSYTPDPASRGATGLLIGPRNTFAAIGAGSDEARFHEFYRRARLVTGAVWPTLMSPLSTRNTLHNRVLAAGDPAAAAAWQALIETPIGRTVVRGGASTTWCAG